MRKALVIAAREYRAAVKTKSFVIGILLMPLLMGGGFIAQILLKDMVDTRPKRFAVLDRSPGGQLYPVLDLAARVHNEKNTDPDGKHRRAPFELERVTVPPDVHLDEVRLAQSERVRDGELIGLLEIGPEVMQPAFTAANVTALDKDGGPEVPEPNALRYQTNRPSYQDFAKWAEATISAAVMVKRAEAKGIKLTDIGALVQPVPLLNRGLTARDPQTGEIKEAAEQNPIVALLLPGGLVILMFMVILLGAAPLMQGVLEEKMQRIAEVLLGSVSPFELMMGKLLGMAGVSLTMASVYLTGSYFAARHYGYAESLSAEVIAWFLLYLVLAVFLFGSIYAAVGAACTDMKEAQAMLTPVTMVTMLPLFVWINVAREPTSAFATGASFFPPATPMLMVARLAIPPGIPLWQPIAGVAVMLAATLACVWAAGRIFRVGILLQGKAPKLGELLRWVLRG